MTPRIKKVAYKEDFKTEKAWNWTGMNKIEQDDKKTEKQNKQVNTAWGENKRADEGYNIDSD